MSQPFIFGFSGDDIEESANDLQDELHISDIQQHRGPVDSSASPLINAAYHSIENLLATLPSKISFTVITISSPNGKSIHVPRRELFDIRMQLMAEDDTNDPTTVVGLDDSDIRTNVYEGGFKSWECSIDLVKYLLAQDNYTFGQETKNKHIVELGCGTALPTLSLFQRALREHSPLAFTLADYNYSVIRLVTLPNLLLNFAATLPAESAPFSPDSPNPLAFEPNGDLDVTPELLEKFTATLASAKISLTLLSGSWLPVGEMMSRIPAGPDDSVLVLGSETIYSPASLRAFAELLAAILERGDRRRALVAAKRVYFGVGGGVDDFVGTCLQYGLTTHEISLGDSQNENMSAGVSRCILDVKIKIT